MHGGLLALRDDEGHVAAMNEHGIGPIDLLIVNLYPFEETVAKGADYDTCIENIDIGGPAMIRAAAKNHKFVNVVVDVEDYQPLLDELEANDGATSYAFRQKLALTAYARTGAYDAAVSAWMDRRPGRDRAAPSCLCRHPGPDPALWREPAPVGGLLHRWLPIVRASPMRPSCRARN